MRVSCARNSGNSDTTMGSRRTAESVTARATSISGAPAPSRAWEGAHGLEWELPSPLPYHTWETPPSDAVIARGAEH